MDHEHPLRASPRRSLPLLWAFSLFTACQTSRDKAPDTAAELPGNVLILLTDDIGVDKTAAYGEQEGQPRTPNITALAEQGVRFTSAYAMPTCSPTRASLLTGRYPTRHGAGRWIYPPDEAYSLADDELTIPELTQTVILSRVGGRTPMPTGEALGDLAHHGTLCLYLSATLTDTITRDLVAAGVDPHTPCAVVQHASMPHQRILRCTVGTLAEVVREARVREQAMILIGPALDPDLKNHPGAHESRLYASDFSHRFRRARPATEQP